VRSLLRTMWNTKGLARYILVIGAVITFVFVLMAIFAPWIAPFDFNQTRDASGVKFEKLASPGGAHLLGTNDQFYDIFSRMIWGARTALEVVLLSVILSAVIGVPLGLVSGFVGGWLDRLLVFVMDAIYALPYLLLAIIFAFLLGNTIGSGIVAAALSLVAIYIPQYFRVVRNTTVSAREATYVEAARAIGARPTTIMRKYLFGNVVQSVPVIGTLNAADAVGTLAALGFIGLGIQPTEASEWGYDLSRALDDAQAGVWWPALWPGLAIIVLITALTLVGEGLNETLNPALRRRRLRPVRFDRYEREEVDA
jgi:peptide/nickel transport system permease protein